MSLTPLLNTDSELRTKLQSLGHTYTTELARELLRKLTGSYESYFALKKNGDSKARIPRYKKQGDPIILSWGNLTVLADSVIVSLPNREKLKIETPPSLKMRIGTNKPCYLTVTRLPHDSRWKIAVVTQYGAPDPIQNPTKVLAIDLGAGYIAMSGFGTNLIAPTRRSDKFWQQNIESLDRAMKRCQKGSRRHNRLVKARRTCFNKSGDQHMSHQRKMAHAIVTDLKPDCIIIGKPKTRIGLTQKAENSGSQNRGIQNTGYMFRFKTYIKEKCIEKGIQFIEFPDPASQGDTHDPSHKLHACHQLLGQYAKKTGADILIPSNAPCSVFRFNQGGKRK